ncbi:MAG: hypothetical protein ACOVRP_14815 [Gemmatimonas sp.]
MIADLLPAKARRVVYRVLAATLAVEAIWNVVPDGTESRIVATLAALGFVLAAGNTIPKES